MEEKSQYYIEKFDVKDFDKLIDLKNQCFNWTVSDDYFTWKFLDNPAGQVVAFVAKEHGSHRMIAFYGVIPEMYAIGGKVVKAYQSCDTMTHNDYRRQGLFNKLATQTYRHIHDTGEYFVIGFGGPTSTPGLLKMGWKEIFKVSNFFKLKAFIQLSNFFGGTSAYDIREVTDLNTLNGILQPDLNPTVVNKVKDLDFVKWRLANPRYKYRVLACYNGQNPLGYVVYYLNEFRDYIIFDLHVPSGNMQVEAQLVKAVEKAVASTQFRALIGFTHKESRLGQSLLRAGYITNPFNKGPLNFKNPFVVLSHEATFNRVNNPNGWNITAIDHDAM